MFHRPMYVSLTYGLNRFKERYKKNKRDIDQKAARQSDIIAKTIAKRYNVSVDNLVIVVHHHPHYSIRAGRGYELFAKDMYLKVYNVR